MRLQVARQVAPPATLLALYPEGGASMRSQAHKGEQAKNTPARLGAPSSLPTRQGGHYYYYYYYYYYY